MEAINLTSSYTNAQNNPNHDGTPGRWNRRCFQTTPPIVGMDHVATKKQTKNTIFGWYVGYLIVLLASAFMCLEVSSDKFSWKWKYK